MTVLEAFCAGLSVGWFLGAWGIYFARRWIWKNGVVD